MKYLSCIFLAALACCACHSPRQSMDTRLPGYRIAYNVHLPDTTQDDWEIMTMRMDGSEKKNILNNDDVAWTYHAFEKRLFFISDRDTCYRCFFLYSTDAEGHKPQKVSNLQLEDSWMSSRNDGQEMVVSGRIGKALRFQLFLLDTRTGAYRQLTHDTAAIFRDPCFSPDGKTIVLSYQAQKRDRSKHEELFLMREDGKNLRQLTNYPETNPSAKEYGYKAGSARWHPTENFITYVSKQDGRNSIFAITPDGTKQWKLLDNSASDGWHDWSPDGKWLVYNKSDPEEKHYRLVLMNWKTKEQKPLTDSLPPSPLGPIFVHE